MIRYDRGWMDQPTRKKMSPATTRMMRMSSVTINTYFFLDFF
jgi:hypothetical protein